MNSGAPLATIAQDQRLMIKGEVSQQYFPQLPLVQSANFRTAYQDQVFALEDFNGRLVSYGKSAGSDAHYLPVYFEMDNRGDLLSGSFLELYLKTKPLENVLVIPRSALMEDYGSYYVYEQISGESFSKREVTLGVDDGMSVQVLSGLQPSSHDRHRRCLPGEDGLNVFFRTCSRTFSLTERIMLNRIIDASLKNRWVVLFLALVISVAGSVIALEMDVDVFPDLTAPTVTVLTEAARHGY